MSGAPVPKKVVFDYPGLKEAEPIFVSGACGTVAAGLVSIHFYTEYQQLVDHSEHPIDQTVVDGQTRQVTMRDLKTPLPADEEGNINVTRRVESSLLMTKDSLRAIVSWMGERLREMEHSA